MSMYGQFKTDAKSERQGIILDYGDFRVTVARASMTNKRYEKVLEARSKASGIERALKRGTATNAKSMQVLKEVYAEAVVLNWEVKNEDDEWKSGVEDEDGTLLPFNRDNVLATFMKLHDLFMEIMEQSSNMALFRTELREELAKN